MKLQRSTHRVRPGFTLPEVLATVLIVSVLSAVAIPLYNSSKADAEEKVCASHLAAIANAESKYRFDNGSFTESGAKLLGSGLAEFPKCPKTGEEYDLKVSKDGKTLTISCAGKEKHAANTKTITLP
jgi:prepilin-type N-terminal cleavage/methylation domain-containing protein